MFCKMDVDDRFLSDAAEYRQMVCGCDLPPSPPLVDCGCRCGACGATCRECPGFGFASPPERNCQEILSRVRAVINRRCRAIRRPPGFVRLGDNEVRQLLRKRRAEDRTHWIHEYVEPGPPVRVFDVLVVIDRRIR
jgi:hypothetical protein